MEEKHPVTTVMILKGNGLRIVKDSSRVRIVQ
mgnify:CR=1 FL=1